VVEETRVKRLLGRIEPATAAKLTAQECRKEFEKMKPFAHHENYRPTCSRQKWNNFTQKPVH